MKKVKITLRGAAPLLVSRFSMEESDSTKKKDKVYDHVKEAEERCYKDDDGYYLPTSHIEASLREASKTFKRGKGTFKKTILSSVFCEDEKMRLPGKYDAVDRRPAIIQRNRIVRARPRWDKWSVTTVVTFDEARISSDVLKEILVEAGGTCGVGDYRPKFGRFTVEEFQVQD